MLRKIIDFFKSRPTETWLGLYAVVVAVLAAFGIDVEATITAAVAAVTAWVATFIAAQPSNDLGPK